MSARITSAVAAAALLLGFGLAQNAAAGHKAHYYGQSAPRMGHDAPHHPHACCKHGMYGKGYGHAPGHGQSRHHRKSHHPQGHGMYGHPYAGQGKSGHSYGHGMVGHPRCHGKYGHGYGKKKHGHPYAGHGKSGHSYGHGMSGHPRCHGKYGHGHGKNKHGHPHGHGMYGHPYAGHGKHGYRKGCGAGLSKHGMGYAKQSGATGDTAVGAEAAKDIVDTALDTQGFSALVAAVKAAGLVETLKGEGPFTVFAPSDDAFAKLPDGYIESLLADEAKLKNILTYHVAAGRITAAELLEKGQVETLQGSTISLDQLNVAQADISTSNGVIHVLEEVLIPTQ